MPFRFPDIPEDFLCGLAIKHLANDFYHVGFLFKKNGELNFCHLAWHHELLNEVFIKEEYLCDDFKLPRVNQKYLISSLQAISDLNAMAVPYGLRAPVKTFDKENRYIGTIHGEGLTCATFVLSVLKTNGFMIINESAWQISDEDTLWQDAIIKGLERTPGISKLHLESAKEMVGRVVRFHPTDVFGCGTADPESWAFEFEDAKLMSQKIKELLAS